MVTKCCYKLILCPPCVGVLYRDAGSISLAVDAYEQCLKIDPDSRNAGQVFCFDQIPQKSFVPYMNILVCVTVLQLFVSTNKQSVQCYASLQV